MPDDPSLLRRLRKRNERKGRGGYLWVRRLDSETVHIYSSIDLAGPRGEPFSGEWLARHAALNQLVDDSLTLPGPERRTWVGPWTKPTESKVEAENFTLGPYSGDLIEDARVEAEGVLRGLHGMNALEWFKPEQIEAIWLPMMKDAIEHQVILRGKPDDEAA